MAAAKNFAAYYKALSRRFPGLPRSAARKLYTTGGLGRKNVVVVPRSVSLRRGRKSRKGRGASAKG